MPLIYIRNYDREIPCQKGQTLLEAALDEGFPMYHTCGGNARCTTCMVRVIAGMHNLSPVDEEEAYMKRARRLSDDKRLSCQAVVLGDVEVDYIGPGSG